MCVSLSLFDLLNLLVADNGCNWMSLVCRAHTIYLFHRQIFLLCSLMLLSLHRKGKFRWKIKMHQRRVNTPRILVRNRKKIPLRLRQNNQTQIIPCHTQETYIVFYPTTESLCTWLNPCSLCRIAENTAAECTPRTYNIIYIILVYVWWFSIMIPTQRCQTSVQGIRGVLTVRSSSSSSSRPSDRQKRDENFSKQNIMMFYMLGPTLNEWYSIECLRQSFWHCVCCDLLNKRKQNEMEKRNESQNYTENKGLHASNCVLTYDNYTFGWHLHSAITTSPLALTSILWFQRHSNSGQSLCHEYHVIILLFDRAIL